VEGFGLLEVIVIELPTLLAAVDWVRVAEA
jgi:hypothetical protein